MARPYKRLSEADLEVLWSRWQHGETAVAISDVLGCDKGAVSWHVDRAGGFAPRPRRRAAWHLTLAEREEISRGVACAEGGAHHRPAARTSPLDHQSRDGAPRRSRALSREPG